jgi:hypothetical protein
MKKLNGFNSEEREKRRWGWLKSKGKDKQKLREFNSREKDKKKIKKREIQHKAMEDVHTFWMAELVYTACDP